MTNEDELDTIELPPHFGKEYKGKTLRHVAMPIGGLGAGQVAICGDGGLRQWEIVNQVNHRGFIPDSFFTIRASSVDPPSDIIRVLQSRQVLEWDAQSTPLVSDGFIPQDQKSLLRHFTGVEKTTFTGAYPFAKVNYEDNELPVGVELQVFNPFVPLNPVVSGLPCAIFTFQVRNKKNYNVHGCLGASLQNVVGWDGLTPISGNQCSLFGGNVNRIRWWKDSLLIVMDNPTLPDDHPGAGEMVLAALHRQAAPYNQWNHPAQFIHFLEGFNLNLGIDARELQMNPVQAFDGREYTKARFNKTRLLFPVGASPRGQTWNAGLIVPFWLEPLTATEINLVITWYFPNRYVNFDQFGLRRDYGKSKFWLGNNYAKKFSNAEEIVKYVVDNRLELERKSLDWAESLFGSSIQEWLVEAIAAQGAHIRSPTCFWSEDGRFYGFEGSLGESTGNWTSTYGGSCPLNCTHVWNYEQTLSRLFPTLERSMRDTELNFVQSPEGYLPHRTVLPLYLPQFWGEPIGGPKNPALDGMLGSLLKVYRELRQGAGIEWFESIWGSVRRLIDYIRSTWDPEEDGIIHGEQPNTFDISFYGPNIYIGGLWLAALLATEKLARLAGDVGYAEDLLELFHKGNKGYDELLWNGEYYIQFLEEDTNIDYQYGKGVLSTQLLGQWWAHQLELGYILPSEHVKTCLRSTVNYNLLHGFQKTNTTGRVFADSYESGLLNCTWPHGGRPELPMRYADEVWTGVEYQVGAHCIMEGLIEDGFQVLSALRGRYTGERRNPYNEIECGDHYARALAGWSVLEAISGFRYNALENRLRFSPVSSSNNFRTPFVAGTGWGTFDQIASDKEIRSFRISCKYGEIQIGSIILPQILGGVYVTLNDKPIDFKIIERDDITQLIFPNILLFTEYSNLNIEIIREDNK